MGWLAEVVVGLWGDLLKWWWVFYQFRWCWSMFYFYVELNMVKCFQSIFYNANKHRENKLFLKIIYIYKYFTMKNILYGKGVYNSKSKRKKRKHVCLEARKWLGSSLLRTEQY